MNICIKFADTRFADTDLTLSEQADMILTMIEEGTLDLRDAFVSCLAVKVSDDGGSMNEAAKLLALA